jgi:hypothetical protein
MPRRPEDAPLSPKASPLTREQIEAMARKAIERRAPGAGDSVTLPLKITLRRAHWEMLSAAGIRTGRNLELVISEILEGGA